MDSRRARALIASLVMAMVYAILCGLVACGGSAPQAPLSPVPEETPRADGLSADQAATLSSLEQVDDYPLYTMHFQGSYKAAASSLARPPTWACSLFAALSDAGHRVYGRNFDWEYSPAVLVFTYPPDGYASVSMVDLAYFFETSEVRRLLDLPLVERAALLETPFWPFDGMNDQGLVVGMAAVPSSPMPQDPNRETIDSLRIIREMLDRARDVNQALDIMDDYNLSWDGGPPLHYLIADASGRAVLVEFYEGKKVVLPNEGPWHLATNFLRSQADERGTHNCWRYDQIWERLERTGGQLTSDEAMDLLATVAQPSTQWSVVYDLNGGHLHVAMGGDYSDVHTLGLERAGE